MIPFGPELRHRRLAANMSLTELSRRVHYSKAHLSKVETGARAASTDLARACDIVLGTDGALAVLVGIPVPRQRARPRPESQFEAALLVNEDGTGRFIDEFAWGLPTCREGGRHLYEWHRMMFDMLRGRGQTTAPGRLLPHLILHTTELGRAAQAAPEGLARPLWLLAARFAEYTGWMAQESGNDEHSLYWTDRAVDFAAAGGDQHLGAYALVRRAEVAMYQFRHRETVALAKKAQTLDCSRRIRGLAAQREAQGHALASDGARCRQALRRAESWLTAPDEEGPLPALGTSNVDDLNGMAAGFTLVDLGDPRPASDLLRARLEQTPPFAQRMKARIGARYALALVGAGEVEHGCAEIRQVLDWCANADSATIRVDLRRLRRALNRWPSAAPVRAVLPRLTALSAG